VGEECNNNILFTVDRSGEIYCENLEDFDHGCEKNNTSVVMMTRKVTGKHAPM
jgi:hypothetical protein